MTASDAAPPDLPPTPPGVPTVVVVMGVSGSGKTTIAELLADRLRWPMLEGDDLHPSANIAKMQAGVPLEDEDRWPWLDSVGDWIDRRLAEGSCAVVTCSALRRAYRDRLRADGVVFVELDGTHRTLERQIGDRKGHFMPASLLESQLATLEPLGTDENGFRVSIEGTPDGIVDRVLDRLNLDPADG